MELQVGPAPKSAQASSSFSCQPRNPLTGALSVSLIPSALQQLSFLHTVSTTPALRHPALLHQALRRYEFLWLPLAAKHEDEVLAAPLDVEWVWHCHLLAPVTYQQDCVRVVGKLVDHKLFSEKDRQEMLKRSRALWRREYKEPFDVDLSHTEPLPRVEGPLRSARSQISYDILAAAARQKVFFYQVSLPHYKDVQFLTNAVVRYRKMLSLKQQNPDKFIVPCYDTDLMWHTHMLHPLLYKADMEGFLGSIFPHDDSVNDRSTESRLNRAQEMTQTLWKNAFKENFSVPGAMFRGDPPDGQLYKVTDKDLDLMVTQRAAVKLDNLQVRTVPSSRGKVVLKVMTSANKKAKSTVSTINFHTLNNRTAVSVNNFNTRNVNGLKFQVVEKKGFGCCGSTSVLEENDVDVLSLINAACARSQHHFYESRSLTLGPDNVLTFTLSCRDFRQGSLVLALRTSKFEEAVMPENVASLWGPVPLKALPQGQTNKCQVASHSLVNHTGSVVFTCRVIHSLPLQQSVVHIFHQDKMAAVAHLVGSDTLPLPTQVKNPAHAVYLNPMAGERAVVIKNNAGDWAFVVGRWSGYKRGTPGKAGVPGVAGTQDTAAVPGVKGIKGKPGSPGTLLVRVWLCREGRWTVIKMPYLKDKFSFTFQGMVTNLFSGAVEIEQGLEETAEKLALTFTDPCCTRSVSPAPKPGNRANP